MRSGSDCLAAEETPTPFGKMHADEVDIDEGLVRRLVDEQFPRWTKLPLQRVYSAGTDNAMYRLGDELVVRLPRKPDTSGRAAKEFRWLPALAPLLPLLVPVPIELGGPGGGYPSNWTICRWLDGENPTIDGQSDRIRVATDLAGFVGALQAIDPSDGPPPGAHNFGRGAPLRSRNDSMRASITASRGLVDVDAIAAAWEADLNAPLWPHSPVWIHGDLAPGNLLMASRRLTGIIDFGGLGVGDPACELLPAWNFFTGAAREVYRAALGVDDDTWARGRGWALSVAVIALPYYLNTNPVIVAWARRMIEEVLADLQ